MSHRTHRAAVLATGMLLACAGGVIAQGNGAPPDDPGKAALMRNPDAKFLEGSVLVKFVDGAPMNARDNARAVINARSMRTYHIVPGLERMQTGMDVERAVKVISQMPWVEYAEPDFILRPTATTPNDEFFSLQWGMNNTGQDIRGTLGVADFDIDMVEAWDIATGDGSFVVAVIDSGTQWSHPDLDDNIWSNTDEIAGNGVDDDGNGYIDDVRGWDFYSGDNNPDDSDGHGTHTAGTIGAEGNNGFGVAGVMWDVQIMPLRFLGPVGGSTSDAITALQYAVDNGAKISNNSWGGGGFSTSLYNAIQAAGNAGHLFVAAAGNGGFNADVNPEYPAGYNLANIISVANMTNTAELAFDSTYGATAVDIGAPGENIASTYNGSSYVWSSGTSMAAPHVTGVAALLWSQNPGWSWSQIKNRIMSTATPTASLSGKSVSGGMLNAYAALTGTVPPPPATPPAAPSNASATANTDNTVDFSWNDNSNNEDGFEIQRERRIRKNNWGETATGTVSANATGITDDPGQTGEFRYRVRAYNGGGSSAWTNWVNVTVGSDGGGNGNGGGKGGGKPK